MACIKFDFDLPGSLGKREHMKEHLIILDASDKYSIFLKEKYIFLVSSKQNLSRGTNQRNLNKEY